MSVLPTPACPTCRADLSLQADHELDAWVCPEGHGLAFTLTEGYERLQEDELHEIWQRARSAPRGRRACPMCNATMVTVAVAPDGDEEANDAEAPAGPGAVGLDVCLVDELLWFDAGELDEFPEDLPDPEPSAEEQAELASVTRTFGEALSAGWDDRERHTVTGKLTALLTRTRETSRAT
jgi:Zn-finger nucleic acid-binding protein